MNCLHCGQDSKYKERSGGRCPKCNHAFAFEPRTGDPLTDRAFQAAIDAVSANNSLFFNTSHLYYEVCRRIARKTDLGKTVLSLSVISLFGGIFVASATGFQLWLVALPLFGAGSYLKFKPLRFKTVRLSREKFDRLLLKWRGAHGAPAKLITRQEVAPLPKAVADDLGEYSFDRAVICDRPGTVDLLVANNFHFENNCAVLAAEGYPAPIFPLVKKMLQRNPRLEVYVLHDATPAGCRLAHELANSPDWFQSHTRIVDVGLRPKHAPSLRGLWIQSGERVLEDSAIRQAEAKWLSRYSLELAAVRPAMLLKRLYRVINKRLKQERQGSDSGADFVYTGDNVVSTSSSEHLGVAAPDADSGLAEAPESDGLDVGDTDDGADGGDADGDAGGDGFG